MTILIADDEEAALNLMKEEVQELYPKADIFTFSWPEKALQFSLETLIDVAFLDIEMPGMKGTALAKKIKEHNPQCNVIFTTAYSEYGLEAMKMHASGYLIKPVTTDDIAREMEGLRYPIEEYKSGVAMMTFGNFDVLVDGSPLLFKRKKAKEMLAYLVQCHGQGTTKKELCAVLFEERPYDRTLQDYFNKILYDLEHTLAEAGAEKIFIKKRNYYAVNRTEFQCDLYDFEEGKPRAISAFHGEYMNQYSWGEEQLGNLMHFES